MKKILGLFIPLLILTVPIVCFAAPPSMPGGNGGSSSSSTASYTGATTISASETLDGQAYTSSTGSENALLVSGGTSTLNNCTVTKSGDSSDENSDFYGTNAAVLVYNGATLNMTGGTVTTNAGHGNGVFAYGTGIINLSNTTIKTTSNNSGGVMVTGGGTLTANTCTVETEGNSSASIRSDRGGGTLTVNGGTYQTNGVGSPAIYSTANITVNNATLTATKSEGAVIEGANSITLNSTILTDTNTSLNGNSETYKNVFIYQSMSGDASEGEGTFTAKDSSFTTNKGDTFFITNTTAVINLTDNTFVNMDGDFLRAQTGKWGNSGFNGGKVTLNMSNQTAGGAIVVDSISTLAMSMTDKSVFTGMIDTENQASKITLNLSSDSVLVLTGDSYVDTLTNAVTDNSNIYLNGYSLYVNGTKVSGNTGSYAGTEDNVDESDTTTDTTATADTTTNKNNSQASLYIACIAVIVILVIAIIVVMIKKHKKTVHPVDL